MSSSEIFIHGSIGKDPTIRFMDSGKAVCNFSVAVDDMQFEKGEWVKKGVTWFSCSAWDDQAEPIAEHVKKGDHVWLRGIPKAGSYEKDGQTIPVINVKVKIMGIVPKPIKKPETNEKGEDPWT